MVCTGCCATLDYIVTYLFKCLTKRRKKSSQGVDEQPSCLRILELHPEMLRQVCTPITYLYFVSFSCFFCMYLVILWIAKTIFSSFELSLNEYSSITADISKRENRLGSSNSCKNYSLVSHPTGSEVFSLSRCWSISVLGLTLRRFYLRYLFEHFNLPHLIPLFSGKNACLALLCRMSARSFLLFRCCKQCWTSSCLRTVETRWYLL